MPKPPHEEVQCSQLSTRKINQSYVDE